MADDIICMQRGCHPMTRLCIGSMGREQQVMIITIILPEFAVLGLDKQKT